MERGHTEMSKDSRPIYSAIGDNGRYIVGSLGVTKIEAYDENGEMAYVPWLAVFQGDELAYRVPARCMSVCYHNSSSDEQPF